MNNRNVGRDGEVLAEKYLTKKNFKMIDKNFHFGRLGEIDIIAEDQDEIVFVEVKYVKSLEFGFPENRITSSKKSKLRKAAEGWLHENNIYDHPCRFDVIAIIHGQKEPEITHFINAF